MSKYYIKCGSLELIYSTSQEPMQAAISALWETNKFDVLDEHFYIDERGFRDYTSADSETKVYKTMMVVEKAEWKWEK